MQLLTIHQQYKKGQYHQALKACEQVQQTQPDNAQVWTLTGLCAQGVGDIHRAHDAFSTALKLTPKDNAVRYNFAVACLQLGDIDTALLELERLADMAPQPAVLINLAHCYSKKGLHHRAIETAVKIVGVAASDPQIILQQALIYERAERFDDAMQHLAKIQALAPTRIPVGLAMARIAHQTSGAAEAAETLATYMRNAGPHPTLIAEHGRYLMQSDQTEFALQTFEQAVQSGFTDSKILNGLGVALSRLRRKDEAKDAFKAALAKSPNDASALYNLAAEYSKATDQNALKEAVDLLTRSIAIQADNAAAYECMAKVCLKLGDNDEAMRAAKTAVSLDPEQTEYPITLSECYFANGNHLKSIETLDAGLSLQPAHPALLRQAGIARLRGGVESEQAVELLAKAYQVDPDDQRTIAHLGVAMASNGAQDEAAQWLGLERHIYPVNIKAPSGFADVQAFNDALANDIVNHSQMRWEPVGLAARGGGLTDDLLADNTPAINGFYDALKDAIVQLKYRLQPREDDPFTRRIPDQYRLELWATLTQDGGNIDTHIHEESWLSGAYYVQLPTCVDGGEQQGWIEFGRPHAEIPMPTGMPLRLEKPQTGTLLLFPSYLFHRTIAHQTSERRISISFDLIPDGNAGH